MSDQRRGMELDAARAAHELFERKFIEAERARIAAEAALAALRERIRCVADYLRERADVQRAAGFPENEYECNVARGFVEAVLEPEGVDDGQ